MLDFYFIAEEISKPINEPLGLDFAGDLDNKTFANLQKKGIIDDRFDYYSDFRWSKLILNQIRERIDRKQMHFDTDVIKLLRLINTALETKSDLIAYGD
ncbi:hypothetical protein [uncultured Fluviicola sp.]|uniref:hypothetical protein n=1 Tax=uncultured Fluviicola sp. TaxID=463303 RepID=UPI0025E705F3|nr:hypothetical protein [uncultured Fluviicola sp.]